MALHGNQIATIIEFYDSFKEDLRLYCRICRIRVMFLVFMRYMKRFSLLNSLRNCFLSIIVILRKYGINYYNTDLLLLI